MIKYEIISTLTDSSQHEIFVGSVGRIILRDNTTYSFHVHAIARASDNSDSSVFEIVGAIKRDSGVASVAFVNSDPLQILPAQESGITRDTVKIGFMRKLCLWYLKGFPDSAKIRNRICSMKNYDEVITLIDSLPDSYVSR